MLTKSELTQINAAFEMMDDDSTFGCVKEKIVGLLETFTNSNVAYGPGSHLQSRPRELNELDNVMLCNTKKLGAVNIV
jgi:hypothetical protein